MTSTTNPKADVFASYARSFNLESTPGYGLFYDVKAYAMSDEKDAYRAINHAWNKENPVAVFKNGRAISVEHVPCRFLFSSQAVWRNQVLFDAAWSVASVVGRLADFFRSAK